MTRLQEINNELRDISMSPRCRQSYDPDRPMVSAMLRFTPTGRLLIVLDGTYCVDAEDVGLIEKIAALMTESAAEMRKLRAAPVELRGNKVDLSKLVLEL